MSKKVIFVPGFFENPWMPRYKKFRQEFTQQHPEIDLDIIKMRWFLKVMTDYISITHRELVKHRPHVAGGFSYGANAVLIAAAKMDPSIRPKRLVLASMSDNFAEELPYSEWHPGYMKRDLKMYHLGDLAEDLGGSTRTFVLASDKELSANHFFDRHVRRMAERLPGNDHPIVVKSGTYHSFNMTSPLYRQAVIDLLSE